MSNNHIKDSLNEYTRIERPHVFLLGAGASLAAFPNGDKNNNKLPLMRDLVDTLDLKDDFFNQGINIEGRNFESIYSELFGDKKYSDLLSLIEAKIYHYFSKLDLSEEPTLYDYLILSLREKDVIATFNWDPFLWQAALRNRSVVKIPHLIFLHGNVAIGYCHKCKKKGQIGSVCSICNRPYQDSKLLYPVEKKNYNLDDAISGEWRMMREYLKNAYIFSVFGYSAPRTDVDAMTLMKSAWGPKEKRDFEQIELINDPKKTQEEISKSWQEFVYAGHNDVHGDFFNSLAVTYPRRSCDAFWSMSMEVKFLNPNQPPKNVSLLKLQEWFGELGKLE